MKLEVASENSVILYITDKPSRATIRQMHSLSDLIRLSLTDVLIDLVPSYTSILIHFDPLKTDHRSVGQKIKELLPSLKDHHSHQLTGKLVRLPVYYGEEVALDLERIAQHHKLNPEEVVTAHCQKIYDVYAIGFAPGFAYLGEVEKHIAMARLEAPRASIPAGSVAIADKQTAIYPAATPGGWNIIGRCPSVLFDPDATPSMPYQVGDQVQFMAINRQEFLDLGGTL
ncbi:5-oxoprolinase subunit PxpB [Reinekea sp.]|jgi:inhibitor of KinA|uniref:5-oxoprolinase subunit PxpB n=1 Tax=Reinekea sp. TaxID=1970455 RepID=UPI003988ED51